MKLLQLNAWGGRLEYLISDLLKEEKPDVLCLQEIISYSGKGSGLFITLEAIQKELNMPYLAFAPVFSFNYMSGVAHFGNAIVSRFEIQKSETVFTHLEYRPDFVWGEHSANMRNFIHATIRINEQVCHVITHHGFWVPDHKNGTEETLAQMQLLKQYIDALDGPVILTGDFNLKPHSESLKILNNILANLSIKHRLKTTRNSLTHKTEVCDYIFINEHVMEKNFKALDAMISDHKALEIEFNI